MTLFVLVAIAVAGIAIGWALVPAVHRARQRHRENAARRVHRG